MLAQRLGQLQQLSAGGGARAVVAPPPPRADGRRRLWRSSAAPPPSASIAPALPVRRVTPQHGRLLNVSASAADKRAAAEAAAAAENDNEDDDDDEDEWEDDDDDEDGEWDEDEGEDEWLDEDEDEEDGEEDIDQTDPPPLERWQEEDFVEVGVVTRAFGVNGEVRVTPFTDQPRRRFGRRGVQLWLLPPRSATGLPAGGVRPPLQPAVVRAGRQVRPEKRGGRPGAAAWAVRLSCTPDRESAERLAGCTLMLRCSDREELPGDDGEFYVQELVGMSVVLEEGEGATAAGPSSPRPRLLGRVVDVLSGTGAHDTLRVRLAPTPADVRRSRYRTVLIPFCEAIVPRVSRSKGEMAVNPPEGLIEATSTQHRMRRAYTEEEKEVLLARLASEGVEDDEEAERAKEEAAEKKNKKKSKGGGRRRTGPPAGRGAGRGGE